MQPLQKILLQRGIQRVVSPLRLHLGLVLVQDSAKLRVLFRGLHGQGMDYREGEFAFAEI